MLTYEAFESVLQEKESNKMFYNTSNTTQPHLTVLKLEWNVLHGKAVHTSLMSWLLNPT